MKNHLKKIVIVFNSLNIGGIETKIIDICNYYSHQKNTKIYLCLKHLTGPNLKFLPNSITIVEPHIPTILKLRTLLFPLWVALKTRQIKPNLCLTFGNYCGITTVIGKQLGCPLSKLIISEDSSILEQIESDKFSALRRLLIKITYPLADQIIVLTPTGKNKILKLIPHLSLTKIKILPNWLPLKFHPLKNKFSRPVDLLFLGRFEPQKNPLNFLKISRTLIENNPQIKIVMVGYGSLENKIKKFILRNNLNSNISILPPVTNSSAYFQRSKIFLLTSDHEGFPLTILEATASGCLPVSKKLDEIKNYFDVEPDLILYQNRNEAVKKILNLFYNPQKIKQLSEYYRQKTLNSQLPNFQKTINLLYKYL